MLTPLLFFSTWVFCFLSWPVLLLIPVPQCVQWIGLSSNLSNSINCSKLSMVTLAVVNWENPHKGTPSEYSLIECEVSWDQLLNSKCMDFWMGFGFFHGNHLWTCYTLCLTIYVPTDMLSRDIAWENYQFSVSIRCFIFFLSSFIPTAISDFSFFLSLNYP